jgi:hypothetical protein
MEIEGKIIKMLPLQTGEGKNGTWKKQEYIIETKGQFPKKVCVALWSEKIDQFQLALNEQVKLSVELESREFNNRWYTDVRVWKAEKLGTSSDTYSSQPDILPPSSSEAPADGDLPF